MYTIYLTTHCNYKCAYCYEDFKSESEFTEYQLIKTIDYIFESDKSNKISICFMGGEPLLKKDLIRQALDYIHEHYRDRLCVYYITTNASLLDDDTIELFKCHHFHVRLSFDGTKFVHNLNRKSKNGMDYYDDIIKKINKLTRENFVFSVRATIAQNTIKYIYENVKYFHSMGINDISMIPDINMELNQQEKDEFARQIEMLRNYYIEELLAGRKFGIDLFDGHFLQFIIHGNNRFEMCNAGVGAFSIMSNGKIYPCGYVMNEENFEIGNLEEGVDTNKSIELLYERYERKDNKCSECNIRFFCMGMKCGYLNYLKTGKVNIPSDLTCFQEKTIYKNVIAIFDVFFKLDSKQLHFLKPVFEFADSRKMELSEYGKKIKEIVYK